MYCCGEFVANNGGVASQWWETGYFVLYLASLLPLTVPQTFYYCLFVHEVCYQHEGYTKLLMCTAPSPSLINTNNVCDTDFSDKITLGFLLS